MYIQCMRLYLLSKCDLYQMGKGGGERLYLVSNIICIVPLPTPLPILSLSHTRFSINESRIFKLFQTHDDRQETQTCEAHQSLLALGEKDLRAGRFQSLFIFLPLLDPGVVL